MDCQTALVDALRDLAAGDRGAAIKALGELTVSLQQGQPMPNVEEAVEAAGVIPEGYHFDQFT